MSSHRQQQYILENPETPVTTSSVPRSALLDYDDIKFINEDIQEIDRDHFHLDTEVRHMGLSRFSMDEPLEVQLRFDGLDETQILLDEHSPSDERWGSGFSRQDNGALGLETTSPNIAFSSSGTNAFKTSSLLRHTNVWSEATSSESVQMLLNSIRQDEINMTTEGSLFEGSDFGELIGSSQNQMELNVWSGSKSTKRDSSPLRLQDVSEAGFETMDEKIHPGFEQSAVDTTEHSRRSPTIWNDSEDNGEEHGSSMLVGNAFSVMDCRLEANKHVSVIGDPFEGNKLEQDISKDACNSLQHMDAVQHLNVESTRVRKEIAGCQFKVVEQMGDEMGPNCVGAPEAEEMISHNLIEAGDKVEGKISEFLNTRGRLDNEGREYTNMVQSCCEMIAEFEQAEVQSMPDSLLEESNEDSPGKHVTEASQEDIVPSRMQGSSKESFHESDENNAYRLDTEAPQDDVMILQGMANPIMDEENEGTAIGSNWTQMGMRREGQAPMFSRSGGSFINSEVRGYATQAESCYIGSTGFGRAEIQGMSGSSLSVNNEDAVEKHMTESSKDDAARELKGIPELQLDESNEKRAEEGYDGVALKVRQEPTLDENHLKNTHKHDPVGSMGDAVMAGVQEMPESYIGTHGMDNMRVHAAEASQQCVVLAKSQGMADPVMGEKESICVGSHSFPDAGNNREAKMTKSPKSRESLDSEEGEDTVMREDATVVVSFHEVRAGFGREENELSDSTLGEINSDSAGKCVTESSPQDLFLVEISVSESSSDKKKEKSVGGIGTVITSQDDDAPLDVEGMPQSVFGVTNEDDTGMHIAKSNCDDAVKKQMQGVADPFFNDKEGMGGSNQNWMELGDKREGEMSELASEESLDYRVRECATVIGPSDQMSAGCGLAEMQVMSDSILDESRRDNARENTTEVLQGNEMQVILSFSLDGSAENVVGKHVVVRSDEDAVMDIHGMFRLLPNAVDKNAEEHSTEASQSDTILAEMQEVPDPSSDEDNDGGGFVGASQDGVSPSLLYGGNQSNTQKCAAEASKEDIVHMERQEISERILNKINEDNGEKQATEASLENATEGEQRVLCTDYERSVNITSVQPENPVDNLAGVLTKENPLSGVLNEDTAQVHATEASQKTDLGERSVLATDYEQSADNSSELLGNCVENVANVLTADKFQVEIRGDALQQNSVLSKELDEGLAGFKKGPECELEYSAREEKSPAGSKDFSSIDVEVRQDTNDYSRNQQISTDHWVRDSVVMSRQIPTGVQLRDSEAMPTGLSLGEGISSSLLNPQIAKTPETLSNTEGEKSMAFMELEERISLDHGACHTGTNDIVASEFQERKGASQLQVSVLTTSVNNTSSLNGNIIKVDVAAVNCEYGEPFSAIQKRKGDEDADPPKLKKTLHEIFLPLVSDSCVVGSSDSTTDMISMDTVPCHLGTNDSIVSEAQETKSVSKLQVDVPTAPVSVGTALVNAMSKTENRTEADEAPTSFEYGDPSSAIQNHMVDEDVDLSPKQTRKLHGKRLSLAGGFCAAGSFSSTASGFYEDAQTSQFSYDASSQVEMRSDQSVHCLSAELQIMGTPLMDHISPQDVQNTNVSLQTPTEIFDNSVVTSPTRNVVKKSLEIVSFPTPTEHRAVQPFSGHKPVSPAKSSICLIEADQSQAKEEKDTVGNCILEPKNAGSMVEGATSVCNSFDSKMKFENTLRESMLLVSCTGQEVVVLGAGAIPVQDPDDLALSMEETLTDKCRQEMQTGSPAIEIDDGHSMQTGIMIHESDKCAEVQQFGATEQDGVHLKVGLSSNGHKCLPISGSGDTLMRNGQSICHLQDLEGKDFKEEENVCHNEPDMTAELPQEDKHEAEKDECEIENSDVSTDLSFQTKNGSSTITGDKKASQVTVLVHDDKKSAVQCDPGPWVEPTCQSEEGEVKAGGLEAAIQTTAESIDAFACRVQTGTVFSQESGDTSTDLPISVHWKSSQSSQPIEVSQGNAPAVHESRCSQLSTFQDEAVKKATGKYVASDDHLVFQEGNSGPTEGKAKCIPDEERGRFVDNAMALGRGLSCVSHISDWRPITSLCTTADANCSPISSGNHSASIDLSSDPGLNDIGTKCNLTSVQTMTLPDLNTTVNQLPALFQQPFTDSQQVQLRAQILTYGSLIQGSLPEESLMIAAFSDAGGSCNGGLSTNCGGNLWERSWHLAAAKIQGNVLCQTSEMMTSMISSPSIATHSMRPVLCSKISEEGIGSLGLPPCTVNVTDSSKSPVIGMRSVDLAATKSHSSRSISVGSPNIGTVGPKNYPTVVMSLSYPLSSPSPVWGTSTPVHEGIQGSNVARNLHLDSHQVTPARHLYQTPHFGNYGSGSTSPPWISNSPSPLPWVSSRAAAEPGLPFSTFLVPEVNREPLNNRSSLSSCVPYNSGIASSPSVTSVMMGTATIHAAADAKTDAQKGSMGVGRQSSIEQKSRKRKKSIRSEETVRTGGLSQAGLLTSATGVFVPLATSSAISSSGSLLVTPSNHAGAIPSSLLETGSSMPYDPSVSHYQIISRGEGKHTVIFSEETASCIEQARLYADEAAFVAASAVKHSEAIWSQLGVHESSGLSSDHEAKLASSAVAAAAAASVAKAAAAAAKVAYEAALQAKLMAAEALASDSATRVNQFDEAGHLRVGREGQTIPNHAMKGRGRDSTSSWKMSNNCHSKVAAARDVTKDMVSAVSAATKRAQNLASIERAAGLAAEAVSQAGAVVAMGDPVPLMLDTLLKAGPDGYWRLENQVARTPGCLDHVQNEAWSSQKNVTGNPETSLRMLESKENKEVCRTEMPRKTEDIGKAPAENSSSHRDEMHTQMSDDVCGNIISIRKDSKVQKDNNKGDAVETGPSVLEVEAAPVEEDVVPDVEHDTKVQKEEFASKLNQIKDGSLVEVVSDEEGLQGVWFSAKVLSLKDGKALVCYDELLSDEGSVQLQEWIPLEEESGKAPRIRMAHPTTLIKFEGTRKRRRAAMGNHVWSVGDHADAWMRDGWWEGIVMGKSEEDESRVTIYFPGGGDTSIIKAWNLRPSLVWKDGQWVEWTSLGLEKEVAPEDELPSGKRQKVYKDDTGREQKGRDKLQKIPNVEEGKKVHQLSAVISSIKDLKSSAGSAMNNRVYRSGLQNEGPRAVSRIPKPAKKRKFMDVSRHYATDTIRNTPAWKLTTKIDKGKAPLSYNQSGWKANRDKKQKKAMILKPKESKLGKQSQDGQNKTQTEKGRSFVANPTAIKKDILGHDLMLSGTPSINVDGSKTNGRMTAGGDVPLSACNEIVAHRPSPLIKAKSALVGETELGSKGKQLGSSNISQNAEKNAKERDHGKTMDIIEPRRSNRRIQPTSKLLEGLQSSPKIMKSSLSASSHEKGGKVQFKTSSLISKGPVSTRNVL